MAKNSTYRVQLRRRREGKTDYQARKALVVSRKPRLVTRGTLRNFIVQITIAKPQGDMVLASANSRELVKKYGWKAPTGNIPAAYLTAYLCGLKAKTAGVKEAVLDIGLIAPTKGAKIFAALEGVLDAGISVPHGEGKIVKERMKGEHIAKYAKSLGTGSEVHAAKFSQYAAQGVAPEKISEHFNKAKAAICASFKGEKLPVETEEEAEEEETFEEEMEPEEEPKVTKAPAKKPEAKEVAPKKKLVEEVSIAKENVAPVAVAKEAVSAKAKTPAKKPVAKKKAAKEEVPVEEEKAPVKKAAKTKATAKPAKPKAAAAKKEPAAKKEKVSKKGEKKE